MLRNNAKQLRNNNKETGGGCAAVNCRTPKKVLDKRVCGMYYCIKLLIQ